MSERLNELTAGALGKKIQAKEVSVKEALDATFAAIDEKEESVHAYITLNRDEAYKTADACLYRSVYGRQVRSWFGPKSIAIHYCAP